MTARCEIELYMVPATDASGRMYAGQPAVAQALCRTHSWYWPPDRTPPTQWPASHPDKMCPLGRIEDATEKAIAEIRRAKEAS